MSLPDNPPARPPMPRHACRILTAIGVSATAIACSISGTSRPSAAKSTSFAPAKKIAYEGAHHLPEMWIVTRTHSGPRDDLDIVRPDQPLGASGLPSFRTCA